MNRMYLLKNYRGGAHGYFTDKLGNERHRLPETIKIHQKTHCVAFYGISNAQHHVDCNKAPKQK